LQEEVQDSFYT